MLTIKNVDISLEDAYKLNSLGYSITAKNNQIIIERD